MTLIINGKQHQIADNSSIEDILIKLQIKENVMAVAVNSQVVKKIDWEHYKPIDNDKIECLNFVGGG